jgi:hypothetical protein
MFSTDWEIPLRLPKSLDASDFWPVDVAATPQCAVRGAGLWQVQLPRPKTDSLHR